MKTKHVVLAVAAGVLILAFVGCERDDSEGDTKYPKEVAAELKKLNKEVEELKADLKNHKASNKNRIQEIEHVLEKQARVQAQLQTQKRTYQPPESTQSGAGVQAAVVNIRRVFQECERGIRYRKEAIIEQDRVVAELEKLSREIEAERASLATLKENSSDYMARAKGLFEKQANYQARQEFYKQQMELKDQLWTKELYQGILRLSSEIAKEKGLSLVFKEGEVDFSEANINELGLAMRVQNLLYSGGCLDITDEVTARLDAEE